MSVVTTVRGALEVAAETRVPSRDMSRYLADLMALSPKWRRETLALLSEDALGQLLVVSQAELGAKWGVFVDDPVGFTTMVLRESVWSKQSEVLAALPAAKRVVVPAGFGLGKCVHEDERIPLADGRMARAGDLAGQHFRVTGWAEDGQQTVRAAHAEWNATEPTWRVTLHSGRTVVRNAAHPLWAATPVVTGTGTRTLTPKVRGWTPIGDLTPGDLILVPERLAVTGARRVDPDHAALLGYLLGDGGVTDTQPTFTQQPGPALDEFTAIVTRMGARLVPKVGRPHCYRIVGDGTFRPRTIGAGRWNPILDLARAWGVHGNLSPEKSLPEWAWTLPNDQLAVVLGRLFACDGWAYAAERPGNRINAQVAIALASERLIRDIETAMLRLGVWGYVRHRRVRYDGGYRDAWEWSCRDREAVTRLADVLDCPGKDDSIGRVADLLAARPVARRPRWPHRNAPDGYRWERVTAVTDAGVARTVAIEVDTDRAFVTTMVEHNTHAAADAAAWFCSVHPVGTALCVTTATRFRQVQRQLWPHIRRLHAKANLPGDCDMTQWKMPDVNGVDTVVAYGFTAPEHDEAAMQGIHAPKVLLIVDEAGGISRMVGSSTRNLLTGDATMLAIGNPATDDETSWFESAAEDGHDPERSDTVTIRIRAVDSPAITGEDTGPCLSCPPNVPDHPIGTHLVDQAWVDDAIREHGEDAPYVIAKVYADFPKGGASRAIPAAYVEAALEAALMDDWWEADYMLPEPVSFDDHDRPYPQQPYRGADIKLGVDVAADGGDELVIARLEGDIARIRLVQSGAANENSTDVAGKVLQEIRAAEILAAAVDSDTRVVVKIDAIGVGWGVAGTLEAWGSEGLHNADIVRVVVSEKPDKPDNPKDQWRPRNKRAELWLNGREQLQPGPDGKPQIRLDIDGKAAAQLRAPTYGTDAGGRTVIESKQSMKDRGVSSPDRAEAVLLALYEPKRKRKGRLLA